MVKGFDLEHEIKDWLLWIGGSMIAALVITNIASFFMGTTTPFVAVTTGSMVHDGTTLERHNAFYLSRNFTQEGINSFPLADGFNPGDAVIVFGARPQDIRRGDVIVFAQERYSMPIIHRVYDIVEKNGTLYFMTKGDHNPVPDPWVVSEDDVLGRAVFRIPYVGIVNTIWVRFLMLFRHN